MRPAKTTSALRAEILDLLLPLQCAARLWSAELRIDCTADELAEAFPDGRRAAYVTEAPDAAGQPYALECYEVSLPGGRLGVRLVSRLSRRTATADELAQLGRAQPSPRVCSVGGLA